MLRVVLAVLLLCSACATVDHDLRARQEAAMRLEAVMGAETIKEIIVVEIADRFPDDVHEKLFEFMDIILDSRSTQRMLVEIFSKNYTVEELDAMTEFYGSAIGQSIIAKTPGYSRALALKMRELREEAVEGGRFSPTTL